MGRKRTTEQRAKVDAGFCERRSFAFRITKLQTWSILLPGVLLTGLIDYFTGSEVWLGPIYMSFIGLAAWALGWRQALGLLGACIFISVIANSQHLYPYEHPVQAWDFIVRIPPIIAIIALLAHARHACEVEWRLARTDQLTGALNRKAFFEMAGAIEESRGWHVLAYADLDGLKALNDMHGHARGDASLKAFARHVRAAIRKDDIFARIGGDEFLVYMPVRDAQAGLTVANRLHVAMNTATNEFFDGLNCSVGALILAPGQRSIDRELRLADELMYEAKQSGAALTVATARLRGEGFASEGRWMSTPAMAYAAAAGNEFRQAPRKEDTEASSSDQQKPGGPTQSRAAA
ncbi:MAG TPA: GGDEF domain-containing protein [Sphingomonadaceae bacterium]|nr:GGDEF domain-containing protein [Sphingomonadaceae bacterium]